LVLFPEKIPLRIPWFSKQTLISLYLEYASYKKNNLAQTTYLKRYLGFYKRSLERCPHQNLKDSLKIREYLVARHVPLKAKEILSVLSEMVEWAKFEEKLPADFKNCFGRYAKDMMVREGNPTIPYQIQELIDQGIYHPTDRRVKGFTKQEAEAIIQAFERQMAARLSDATPWDLIVKFLFMTGCRHGECAALKWKDIAHDCSYIVFSRSYDDRLHLEKTTKTYEPRDFPCHPALQKFLLEIKPKNVELNDLVFHSHKKTHIIWESLNQFWNGKGTDPNSPGYIRGILPMLICEGKSKTYQSPYGTRHTFINAQLNAGMSPKDVARLVGNTPETISKYYESASREIVSPISYL
jgi:integrase